MQRGNNRLCKCDECLFRVLVSIVSGVKIFSTLVVVGRCLEEAEECVTSAWQGIGNQNCTKTFARNAL